MYKCYLQELFAVDESPKKAKLFDGSVAGNVKTHSASASATTPNMMSSSELLSRMRSRNYAAVGDDEEPGEEGDFRVDRVPGLPAGFNKASVELITDIRNYVAYQAHMDGRASTQELLEEFKNRVAAHDSAKFKAMLKQICDFDKVGGIGMWFLKPEFK